MKRLVAALLASLLLAPSALAAHGVAQFGEPKYKAGFSHFDYVNPDAPKGGSVTLSLIAQHSSYDKFNPFNLKGKLAPGPLELMFETLTVNSLDEVNTQYGLLADDINLAPDFSWVEFRLHPKARFNNGDPVTAADVKYSFDTLTSKQASPRFKSYFAEIKRVLVVDSRVVRFEFARPGRDLSFVAGSLPVFSPKWGLKPDGTRTDFADLRLEEPITSGPYRIERANPLSIIYRRDPSYWGNNIPTRRGGYNFDQVVYKLYKDVDTQVAALRAGDFDFFNETRMRYWCCQFIGERFEKGELIKEKVPNGSLSPMSGYVLNLRQPRFQDIRVRQALFLAYDWEWLNRMIFDSEFERQDGFFANSNLAAQGRPSAAELALLEPFRDQLPPTVFGPMVNLPRTDRPGGLRANLAQAMELLADAGWRNVDGVLRNGKGEPFTLEVTGGNGNVLLDAYYLNLTKLGVQLTRRVADPTVDRQKLRSFQFDFTSIALRKARDPAPELWRNFNSADADIKGSENIAGVKSPVVDALLRTLQEAQTPEQVQTAAGALDRVLMHHYYVLPWRYLKNHYLIYNQRLRRPATVPGYFGPYEWLLAAWWDGTAMTLQR
ncbi:extracellular solute-binding protein [Niveispirillum cyanobacteriorum]|uniref:ABC transporter substrate-binding protein n=1 Tax=Niveispirillum cyanobacteriorum TaxID=1612173 RepID=A0A2K9NJ38_9PROT|nr:extracellular solute-binding protein [Niveispirillum cyanobacteriorum]AUN32606.1 ABC transporter substrate-binding protein [Niveispirillum cyanobacteriorum]GGE76767.1 ABC transporter substrate-binding protein [Niveispirillum cyanobacteriorum]